MQRRRKALAGVTLIEMLVVITIISLVAGMVTVYAIRQLDVAKVKDAQNQIRAFRSALEFYKKDVGTYPASEQGLQALRVKPPDAENWGGPYISDDVPPDPWHHPYIYKFPGTNPDEPDIISYGQDGQPGGEGLNADIVNGK